MPAPKLKVHGVKQFTGELKQLSRVLDIRMSKLLRLLSFHIFDRLVAISPINLGRFKSSWNYTVDRIDMSNTPPLPKGTKMTENQAAQIALARKVNAKHIRPYSQIFLTNSVEYGPALERGHSKQAAQGMVKVTMAAWDKWIREVNTGIRRESALTGPEYKD